MGSEYTHGGKAMQEISAVESIATTHNVPFVPREHVDARERANGNVLRVFLVVFREGAITNIE